MKNCIWLYIFVLLLATSCANRVTPSGGDKDIIPPKLESATPANFSLQMKDKQIVLEFDEWIALKDPANQILISPLLEPAPEFKAKKKAVIIDLPDTLKENTTYTINFGSAITDVHEGNEFPFQYVFSTGNVLDSLYISGTAVDALTLAGKKGVKINLYSGEDDSLPLKKKPDYFALTDDNGKFRISNISPGNYSLVAIDDKNTNYLNDNLQEEAISLLKKVTLPDTTNFNLKYFTQSPKDVYIKSNNAAAPGRWDIILSRGITNPSSDLNNKLYRSEWTINNDTLSIWNKDSVADSLSIIISENGIPVDTSLIRIKTKKSSSKQIDSGRGQSLNGFVEKYHVTSLIDGMPAEFQFFNPISLIDTTKIIFKEDTIVRNYSFVLSDSLQRRLHLNYKWKEGSAYYLQFLPGAFQDFTGRKNDTIVYNFSGKKISETGSIKLAIKGLKNEHYILQLLTGDLQLVRELKVNSDGNYEFLYLEPQQLKARLIRDDNNNGKWDSGNYFKKKEAEEVYYYTGELQSRANWEVETLWELKIINSKL